MPKRSNLEGTKLADGRWQIRISLTTIEGKKVRKAVYGKTKAEAQKKAHALIHEESRRVSNGSTFGEVARVWLHLIEVAEKTKASYTRDVETLSKRWGNLELDNITAPMIYQWLDTLPPSRTREMLKTRMGTIFNFAVSRGMCKNNPVASIKLPKRKNVKRVRLNEEAAEQFIAAMPERFRVFLCFLADTGVRPWKEGIHATREDIGRSMDQFYMTVRESKTRAGQRIVPITDTRVIDHIMSIESGPLWDFTYEAIKKQLHNVREELDFDVQFYALRRFAITKWCEERPLDEVMRLAGHEDLSMTLQIYNEVARHRILTGGVKHGISLREFTKE